jgi:two-component system heavy metal sensor histidine kinase CusS
VALKIGLRTRMVVAVTVLTLVTLEAAFAVISVVVTRERERHLDDALLRAASEEVEDAAGMAPDQVALGEKPSLHVHEIGALTKYAAIYEAGGRVRSASAAFGGAPPPLGSLAREAGVFFDLSAGHTRLRAVMSAVPNHPGTLLLMAAPRTEIDQDAVRLRRAMFLVFGVALAWTVVVAIVIAVRLSRAQRRMAAVVREVAAGNLQARVGPTSTSEDEAQLARDIDHMIERLAALLDAQRVFVAHAAHELRSPLTVLYGELALALRRARDAAEYRQTIEMALASTHELKDLAEDLLAVARLGASPPPPAEGCDVAAAVEEANRLVPLEEGPPGVRVAISGACGPARAGHRDLVRLFRNLLENALRHSPAGGTVRCELSQREGRSVVTITDEGPGVPASARGQIFAPFFRDGGESAIPRLHGAESGLGLTIARGIARGYGGDVVLDEGFEQGARFEVTLPQASGAGSVSSNLRQVPAPNLATGTPARSAR